MLGSNVLPHRRSGGWCFLSFFHPQYHERLDKRFHRNEWPAEDVENWITRFETDYSSSLFEIIQHVPRFWYSGDINQVAESLVRRLGMLRTLFSEELKRKQVVCSLSHMNLSDDAKVSLHRFESPLYGNFKKRPALHFSCRVRGRGRD
jgi:hypothetical protein